MKPGDNLQRLVTAIEQAIHGTSNVRVESPKRLPDKDTGQLREHDVVLSFDLEHHTVLLAIECRDRSRKIGVPEIEAFSRKCERTGVHRGVMVSALGFWQSALKKAAEMEIGCLSLEQVDQFDWCLTPFVEYCERNLIHERPWDVATAGTFEGEPQLYDNSGAMIDVKRMSELAHGYLAMRPLSLAVQQDNDARLHSVTCTVRIDMPELYLKNQRGELIRITRLIAYVTYSATPKLIPFEFREYINRATGKLITSAAVARLNGAAGEADFVVQRAPDGAMSMTLLPRDPLK